MSYDPAARRPGGSRRRLRPPDDSGSILHVVMWLDDDPGHYVALDPADPAVVVERWTDDHGMVAEARHPVPWDWSTDPPHAAPPPPPPSYEWSCPLCEAATQVTDQAQLAQFIVSHVCTDQSARSGGHGLLRVVPITPPTASMD